MSKFATATPGSGVATFSTFGAAFKKKYLQQTQKSTNSIGGEPQLSPPGNSKNNLSPQMNTFNRINTKRFFNKNNNNDELLITSESDAFDRISP